jgi:hypothetical protein
LCHRSLQSRSVGIVIPQQYRRQPTRKADNLALGVERGGADSTGRHAGPRDLEGSGSSGHLGRRQKCSRKTKNCYQFILKREEIGISKSKKKIDL